MISRRALALLFGGMVLFAAQPLDLSGSWKLNTDKSKWGRRDKPTAIELKIEHHDPQIQYTGTVIDANGANPREFSFTGAVDGKAYPVEGPDGHGTMAIQKVNTWVTRWTYKSDDGKVLEEATTEVSRDGRQLTRSVHRKAPQGEFNWTEVYDRS